jgi:triosephosphate isomerase
VSLETVAHAIGSRRDLDTGVQNVWTEDRGAFTGETSAPMAKDARAKYALVGHSERRHVFGETDEQTAKKCAAAARSGLVPILCVGELLSEREAGDTNTVVLRQVRAGLADVSPDVVSAMAIAYEPVWAIGTGRTATPDDAAVVHVEIRRALAERLGREATEVPILYGGSVNSTNAPALMAAEGVDGLLVGGASLDVDGWTRICET